jgi:hypothetical protein
MHRHSGRQRVATDASTEVSAIKLEKSPVLVDDNAVNSEGCLRDADAPKARRNALDA